MIETNTLPFVVSVYPHLCQFHLSIRPSSISYKKSFFSEQRERPCWLAMVDSAPQTAPPQSETWHFRGLDYVDLTVYCGAKD